MNESCLLCGGEITPRAKPTRGTRPKFCSEDCRKTNLKRYYREWCAANRLSVAERRDQNRLQVRTWNREFYARNRERRKELRRAIYKANPEKALAAAREYDARNPDRRRALGRKSQLKRRAVIAKVFVETVDPIVVFERDQGKCGICMKPVHNTDRWEVDHVIPISKGGRHAYTNVQLAHRRCNRSKGAKWEAA